MKTLLALVVLALAAHAAFAAKVPQPIATDQRIRQVVYSASEVYEVTGSYRFTTTIEFEKGETVQYLTLGDTIAFVRRQIHDAATHFRRDLHLGGLDMAGDTHCPRGHVLHPFHFIGVHRDELHAAIRRDARLVGAVLRMHGVLPVQDLALAFRFLRRAGLLLLLCAGSRHGMAGVRVIREQAAFHTHPRDHVLDGIALPLWTRVRAWALATRAIQQGRLWLYLLYLLGALLALMVYLTLRGGGPAS